MRFHLVGWRWLWWTTTNVLVIIILIIKKKYVKIDIYRELVWIYSIYKCCYSFLFSAAVCYSCGTIMYGHTSIYSIHLASEYAFNREQGREITTHIVDSSTHCFIWFIATVYYICRMFVFALLTGNHCFMFIVVFIGYLDIFGRNDPITKEGQVKFGTKTWEINKQSYDLFHVLFYEWGFRCMNLFLQEIN